MKKYLIVILSVCFTMVAFPQQNNSKVLEREAREDIREGNKLYNQLKFEEAEILYKKALSKNPNYPKATYNLGNTIYQQERNKEAVNQYELVEKSFDQKMDKAEAYHNMGNAFMKEKQYDKAVEVFKNSLRNNSKDDETRYNLALAQEMLKNQQQENKDNKDDKNKDNKEDKNKENKDKEGGDEEKQNDKNEKEDKGKDKQDDQGDEKKDNNQKDQEKKEQQPRKNQLSPEQMKQLLEAMNNEENKTQKKLNAEKAKSKKIKQEKDW